MRPSGYGDRLVTEIVCDQVLQFGTVCTYSIFDPKFDFMLCFDIVAHYTRNCYTLSITIILSVDQDVFS